jgi:hypothetical protein
MTRHQLANIQTRPQPDIFRHSRVFMSTSEKPTLTFFRIFAQIKLFRKGSCLNFFNKKLSFTDTMGT